MPSDRLVVTPTRNRPPGASRARRPYKGWLLHVPACRHARGALGTQPAPEVPYANTEPCRSCRPDIEHRIAYAPLPGGGWVARCSMCGPDTPSRSRDAARQKARTRHLRAGVPMVTEPEVATT
jgi:hypothetical protein